MKAHLHESPSNHACSQSHKSAAERRKPILRAAESMTMSIVFIQEFATKHENKRSCTNKSSATTEQRLLERLKSKHVTRFQLNAITSAKNTREVQNSQGRIQTSKTTRVFKVSSDRRRTPLLPEASMNRRRGLFSLPGARGSLAPNPHLPDWFLSTHPTPADPEAVGSTEESSSGRPVR